MSEKVTTTLDGAIAVITVDNPEKRNAMDIEIREALRTDLEHAAHEDDVGAIILQGGGDTFIAGSDVTAFPEMDPLEAKAYTQHTQDLYNYLEAIPKPVIAAIDGYAMGGGLEIALCCDLRVASEDAKFAQSEIVMGAIPGGGGTQRLPRLVGMGIAKELMMTGKTIPAERAFDIGLINEIVPANDVLAAAKHQCREILQHSRTAVGLLKDVINQGNRTDLQSGLEIERLGMALAFANQDMQEAVSAFLDNRDPDFEAR